VEIDPLQMFCLALPCPRSDQAAAVDAYEDYQIAVYNSNVHILILVARMVLWLGSVPSNSVERREENEAGRNIIPQSGDR
jgi:hypothetical protein